MLGGSQEANTSAYRTHGHHPSSGPSYGGQYSAVYGSTAQQVCYMLQSIYVSSILGLWREYISLKNYRVENFEAHNTKTHGSALLHLFSQDSSCFWSFFFSLEAIYDYANKMKQLILPVWLYNLILKYLFKLFK